MVLWQFIYFFNLWKELPGNNDGHENKKKTRSGKTVCSEEVGKKVIKGNIWRNISLYC